MTNCLLCLNFKFHPRLFHAHLTLALLSNRQKTKEKRNLDQGCDILLFTFLCCRQNEKKTCLSHTFIELNVKIIVELHMFDGSDGPYGNFFNCNTRGTGFNCCLRTTWHAIVFQNAFKIPIMVMIIHHDHLHLDHLMSMFLKMFLMAVQRAFVSLTIPMLPKSQSEL